ncbi:MAG TPA: ATP-binding protein [Candidatus Dormibacteraeota bacterium]|nr:ATP-binding protein [Candidatus Dormibacteraeota bacterium]
MASAWPPSPYRPGNGIDPPYLGDREEQIEAVRAFLKNYRHPRNVLITGLRGVGKTVLLNHLQGEAEEGGWLVVDREFSEPDVEPAAFANALLTDVNRALRRLSLSTRLKEKAAQLLQVASDSVGALTVSYGEFKVSVAPNRRRTEPQRRLDDDLKEALMRICELCQKSEYKGLVLRYDEFHVVRERPGTPTLSALLSATSAVQQHGLPLMLMLCGLPPVVDNLARSKSYSERMFATLELGNLRPPEDRAALVDPAVRLGRRYADEVVDAVMEDSGGYPFFIQVYGDALWTGSQAEMIAMPDFRRLRPRILSTLDAGFFRARYVRASPNERQLMRNIATFGESATIEQLQQASGRKNNAIQPTVSALIQKGLVYRPERARIAFTAPMFGAFLLRTPN